MSRGARLTLTVLAAALALAGLTASYVKLELADPDAFADRSLRALRSDAVKTVIAEQIVVAVLERRSPDLVATRPLVITAVEAVVGTRQFSRVVRRAVVIAHGVLLRGERDVRVELADIREVLLPALETASPALARQVPTDLRPQIAEVRASDAATGAIRLFDGAALAAVPMLAAALAALTAAVAFADNRRQALRTAGIALAVSMGCGLVGLAVLRAQVLARAGEIGILPPDAARAAAGAAWEALAGGLQRWLTLAGIGGLVVWAGAALAETRLDRRAGAHAVAELLAGGAPSNPARVVRGVALVAVGTAVVLAIDPIAQVVALAIGGALLLLGLADALSVAGGPRRPTPSARPRRHRVALAAGCVLVAGAAATVALVVRDGPPPPLESSEITACNGHAELCERRLDEVVVAGTHNSMSAADRPGWFFANQSLPIPRQLDDGIRLLMVDPHYGIVDREGRIRTDLAAEGTDRNRVAAELGFDAVRAAERLAGRLDLLPAEGEREIFLCHTLCELGAERLSSTLKAIRGWLERNPAETLVLLLESSVDPAEIEEAFDDASLLSYVATLPRDGPLPTLRELVTTGRRLVVLDERDGGDAPWLQPAFRFVQNTSIEAFTESRAACDPGRGTPDSPMLVINHWVDRFPPPQTSAAELNRRAALLRRARRCRGRLGRMPTAIAVDFYDRGDLIATVDELNTG